MQYFYFSFLFYFQFNYFSEMCVFCTSRKFPIFIFPIYFRSGKFLLLLKCLKIYFRFFLDVGILYIYFLLYFYFFTFLEKCKNPTSIKFLIFKKATSRRCRKNALLFFFLFSEIALRLDVRFLYF